jgi:hypothetical protein
MNRGPGFGNGKRFIRKVRARRGQGPALEAALPGALGKIMERGWRERGEKVERAWRKRGELLGGGLAFLTLARDLHAFPTDQK